MSFRVNNSIFTRLRRDTLTQIDTLRRQARTQDKAGQMVDLATTRLKLKTMERLLEARTPDQRGVLREKIAGEKKKAVGHGTIGAEERFTEALDLFDIWAKKADNAAAHAQDANQRRLSSAPVAPMPGKSPKRGGMGYSAATGIART